MKLDVDELSLEVLGEVEGGLAIQLVRGVGCEYTHEDDVGEARRALFAGRQENE